MKFLFAHRVDEHEKSLNQQTKIELLNLQHLAVKAWKLKMFGAHLNSAVEEAVVLTWAVEKTFGVGQLVLLVWWWSKNVHREVSRHRRFVRSRHVRLEVCADSHFIIFVWVITSLSLLAVYWFLWVTVVVICQEKIEELNVGYIVKRWIWKMQIEINEATTNDRVI